MLAMLMLTNLLQVPVDTSCLFQLVIRYSLSLDDLCCYFLGAVYRIRQYDAADMGSTGSLWADSIR